MTRRRRRRTGPSLLQVLDAAPRPASVNRPGCAGDRSSPRDDRPDLVLRKVRTAADAAGMPHYHSPRLSTAAGSKSWAQATQTTSVPDIGSTSQVGRRVESWRTQQHGAAFQGASEGECTKERMQIRQGVDDIQLWNQSSYV